MPMVSHAERRAAARHFAAKPAAALVLHPSVHSSWYNSDWLLLLFVVCRRSHADGAARAVARWVVRPALSWCFAYCGDGGAACTPWIDRAHAPEPGLFCQPLSRHRDAPEAFKRGSAA
jgi:hypothetical protein